MFSDFFFSENRFIYEIMLKNAVKFDRPLMTVLNGTENIRFACRITEARIETYVYNI